VPSDRWNDLRAFLRFLDAKLETSPEGLTLDDVLAQWDYETQSEEERQETIEAIRQGLKDADEGRSYPADEVIAELRRKHNLPPV
jgi:predicted transcriptional regulator